MFRLFSEDSVGIFLEPSDPRRQSGSGPSLTMSNQGAYKKNTKSLVKKKTQQEKLRNIGNYRIDPAQISFVVSNHPPLKPPLQMTQKFHTRLPTVAITLYKGINISKPNVFVSIRIGAMGCVVRSPTCTSSKTDPVWDSDFPEYLIESDSTCMIKPFLASVWLYTITSKQESKPVGFFEVDLYNDLEMRCRGDQRKFHFPLNTGGKLSMSFTATRDFSFPTMNYANVDGARSTAHLPFKARCQVELTVYQCVGLTGFEALQSGVIVFQQTGASKFQLLKTRLAQGHSPFWMESARFEIKTNADELVLKLFYVLGENKNFYNDGQEEDICTIKVPEIAKLATYEESRRWYFFSGVVSGVIGLGFRACSNMDALKRIDEPILPISPEAKKKKKQKRLTFSRGTARYPLNLLPETATNSMTNISLSSEEEQYRTVGSTRNFHQRIPSAEERYRGSIRYDDELSMTPEESMIFTDMSPVLRTNIEKRGSAQRKKMKKHPNDVNEGRKDEKKDLPPVFEEEEGGEHDGGEVISLIDTSTGYWNDWDDQHPDIPFDRVDEIAVITDLIMHEESVEDTSWFWEDWDDQHLNMVREEFHASDYEISLDTSYDTELPLLSFSETPFVREDTPLQSPTSPHPSTLPLPPPPLPPPPHFKTSGAHVTPEIEIILSPSSRRADAQSPAESPRTIHARSPSPSPDRKIGVRRRSETQPKFKDPSSPSSTRQRIPSSGSSGDPAKKIKISESPPNATDPTSALSISQRTPKWSRARSASKEPSEGTSPPSQFSCSEPSSPPPARSLPVIPHSSSYEGKSRPLKIPTPAQQSELNHITQGLISEYEKIHSPRLPLRQKTQISPRTGEGTRDCTLCRQPFPEHQTKEIQPGKIFCPACLVLLLERIRVYRSRSPSTAIQYI